MSRRSPESSESSSSSDSREIAAPDSPEGQEEKSGSPPVAAKSSVNSMLRDKRIGIIGAGAMGGALCRGLVHASAAPANRILVSDPHPSHVHHLQTELGIKRA